MYKMCWDIQIGKHKLALLDSVEIKKSVETLCDTAVISLPGTIINKAINIESKIKEGDAVTIRLGYDSNDNLKTEFTGYVESIATDNDKLEIRCEDAIYLYRASLKDVELKSVTVKELLSHVNTEIGKGYKLSCDYEFKYDKFVIKDAAGWDVLKKVQDETKANIYFKGDTLHVHPQYSEITNEKSVIYDFYVNIEKSDLKYKHADQRKYQVEVTGVGTDGKQIKEIIGKTGGEKRSVQVYGVTDKATLKKRGEEELALVVYTGYEGSLTGWLLPYCEPAYKVEIRDHEYPEKNGLYYVIATDVKFSSSGGERVVTIGKKLG